MFFWREFFEKDHRFFKGQKVGDFLHSFRFSFCKNCLATWSKCLESNANITSESAEKRLEFCFWKLDKKSHHIQWVLTKEVEFGANRLISDLNHQVVTHSVARMLRPKTVRCLKIPGLWFEFASRHREIDGVHISTHWKKRNPLKILNFLNKMNSNLQIEGFIKQWKQRSSLPSGFMFRTLWKLLTR